MPTGAAAVKTGANPAEFGLFRRSSVVEHPLHTRVVGGSNPSAGTIIFTIENWSGAYWDAFSRNRETQKHESRTGLH